MDESDGGQMGSHNSEPGHYHLQSTEAGRYQQRNIRADHYRLTKLKSGNNNSGETKDSDVAVFHDAKMSNSSKMDGNNGALMGSHSTGTGHYHLQSSGAIKKRYQQNDIRTGHYHLRELNGENNNIGETEDSEVFHDVPSVDNSADMSNGESLTKTSIVLDSHMSKTPQVMYSEESPPEKKESKEQREDRISYKGPVLMDIHNNIETQFNTRALPKDAPTYQLETFEKHALLILIQTSIKKYDSKLNIKNDVVVLRNTFRQYGFEVQIEAELTKKEIMTKLMNFSSRDLTDYGCVAVAVLTHGSKHGFISAKDEEFSQLEIVKHLQVQNKPTLVTKPKLVVIETCRDIDIGTAELVAHDTIARRRVHLEQSYILPTESDLLVVHSSYIGRLSADRKIISGAWFIKSLCAQIQELASNLDLESILTEVKREAVEKFGIEYYRQPVTTSSTLIRKLHLKRFIKETPKLTSSAKMVLGTSVLDNSSPKLPLFVKLGPCSCFLEHYSYITKCLQYFLEDHPDDATAKSLLDVASTFDKGVRFNDSKEKMAKAICDYLRNVASDRPYSKYLFFYKH